MLNLRGWGDGQNIKKEKEGEDGDEKYPVAKEKNDEGYEKR